MAFAINKGISAIAVRSIPKEWDPEWFRRFVTNYMQNADVRNSNTANGVTVAGTVVTPGTIGASFTLSSLAPIPAFTVVANDTGAPASPVAISEAQLTSMVQVFTNILNGAVPASGGGTTTWLRADATFSALPGGFSGFAPPSGKAALVAAAGVASTAIRSDANIAIDQTIAPTWAGAHTFTPSGAVTAITVNAATSQVALAINGAPGVQPVTIRSGTGAAVTAADLVVSRAGSTANQLAQGPNLELFDTTNSTLSLIQHSGGQTELWQFNAAWHQLAFWGINRGANLIAPASGPALTVNGVGGTTVGIQVSNGHGLYTAGAGVIGLQMNSAGTDWGMVQNTSSNRWALAHGTAAGVLGTESLVWTAANDLFGRGVSVCKFKSANTSRTNTAVLADDPDLVYAVPAAGTYRVLIMLYWSAAVAGTIPGAGWRVNFTGTLDANAGNDLIVTGFMNGSLFQIGNPINLNEVGFTVGTTVTNSLIMFVGTMTATSAGTFSIQWCQGTSSANATTLHAGSCFELCQLN